MVGSMDSTTYDATYDQRATYSETGPGVSIWAPGTNIMSSTSNTNRWGAGSQNYYLNASYKQTNISGTSMATPHVAGAAAVLRGAWPLLTADDVVALLLTTATDLGATGVDDIFGKGLLNLEAAVAPVGGASLSSGSSVDSAGYDISTASLTVDPIFGDAFSTNVASQLNSAVFFDDFGRDFKADLGSKITQTASYTVPTLDKKSPSLFPIDQLIGVLRSRKRWSWLVSL